jgi:Ca2+/Na+ antiporter
MFFILIIVVSLVAWALHLMQEAVARREFSLMLAGFLVSSAAAAMMTVYFLMGHCVGYLTQAAAQQSFSSVSSSTSSEWVMSLEADMQEWSGGWAGAVDRQLDRS